jgi:hypothetical protein
MTTPEEYNAQLQTLQQRRAIANAMLTQSMNAGKDWGNDRYRHSPWEVVANLGSTYLNKQTADAADAKVQDATKARQAEIAQAMSQYSAATPDEDVGAKALENLRAAPADELPAAVMPRSAALRNLGAAAMGPDQMAQAAVTQAMTPDKLTEVAPGASLYNARLGKVTYTAPPKPPEPAKRTVEYKDAGNELVPVYSDSGERVPNLKPIAKALTPGQEATKAARTPGQSLSDEAVDLAAKRLLNGEPASAVLANFGRGTQGAANITAVQNHFAQLAASAGMDAEGIATKTQELGSEKRARLELGAREGKIAPRVQEAQNFAHIAKEASAAVPRGAFVPWTKLKQAADTRLSDPALAKLKAATNSLINAYAAAVGGGVPTVHDKEAADKMLSTAQSREAYDAVVDQLILETEAALQAPKQVMRDMRAESTHKTEGAAPPTTNSKGWVLHKDAKGNQAYVSPDGKSFEEVK